MFFQARFIFYEKIKFRILKLLHFNKTMVKVLSVRKYTRNKKDYDVYTLQKPSLNKLLRGNKWKLFMLL